METPYKLHTTETFVLIIKANSKKAITCFTSIDEVAHKRLELISSLLNGEHVKDAAGSLKQCDLIPPFIVRQTAVYPQLEDSTGVAICFIGMHPQMDQRAFDIRNLLNGMIETNEMSQMLSQLNDKEG